ncbi:MAG: FKBP-type peptidyl-prolyl cis-trans isomerase [Myxococcaceae bacterium]
MRKIVVAVVVLAAGMAFAQAAPKTDDEKTLYTLGYQLGKVFMPSKGELEIIKKGMADATAGAKPAIDIEQFGDQQHQGQLAQARAKLGAAKEKEKSKAFIDKAAAEKGAQKLPSGLVYQELKAGTGESPKATDQVSVHYRGTLTDGTEFDSSYKRGQPVDFPLNAVIPCWTEGVQKMKPGGKAKLVCPSDIAYGDMGRPPKIPGGATLVFEVELLSVKPGQPQQNPMLQMPQGGQQQH